MQDLTMLRTALRNDRDYVTPEDEISSVSTLIDFVGRTALVDAQPHWSSLQLRNIVMGADAVPITTLATLRATLVHRIAESCIVEDDQEDNLRFWAEFIDEGSHVVAENRCLRIAEQLEEPAILEMVYPTLAQAA